jgi:hypothetical protein
MDSKTILVIAMIVIIFILFYMFFQKPTDNSGTLYNSKTTSGTCSKCPVFENCSSRWGTYGGVTGCIYTCPGWFNRYTTYICKDGNCTDCQVISS